MTNLVLDFGGESTEECSLNFFGYLGIGGRDLESGSMFFRPPSRKVGTNHAETHLRSDNITTIYLLCCFDAPQHTSFPHAMADIQKGGIHASLSSIFKSEKYSDLIIRCGDRVFKVHRAIVCPRSHFFAAACDGPFQASGGSIHQARLTFIRNLLIKRSH